MKALKKDFIFAGLALVVGVLLFLLRFTGMTAHIVLSFVGIAVLVTYAIQTRKEWKLPALEILMRIFYATAFITGIIVMKVPAIAALAIVHKACAALFVVLLVVLFVHKAMKSK